MSRTANDFRTSGGFLPVFEDVNPAPTVHDVESPEDKGPWTPAHDEKLRQALAIYVQMKNEEAIPWPLIATKANFGHNSGSCKKRWNEVLKLNQTKWHNVKAVQFGGKGSSIVGFTGQYKTVRRPSEPRATATAALATAAALATTAAFCPQPAR